MGLGLHDAFDMETMIPGHTVVRVQTQLYLLTSADGIYHIHTRRFSNNNKIICKGIHLVSRDVCRNETIANPVSAIFLKFKTSSWVFPTLPR